MNGLKFYFRALHTASDAEERLALAVASLETSLLSDISREHEAVPIAYRLRQRTAALLRLAGLEAAAVFSDMNKAYRFRSLYAHGTGIEASDFEKVKELCPRILDYARLVVIKFIDVSRSERRSILTALDRSLLDDKARTDLEKKLSGGLWDYALD